MVALFDISELLNVFYRQCFAPLGSHFEAIEQASIQPNCACVCVRVTVAWACVCVACVRWHLDCMLKWSLTCTSLSVGKTSVSLLCRLCTSSVYVTTYSLCLSQSLVHVNVGYARRNVFCMHQSSMCTSRRHSCTSTNKGERRFGGYARWNMQGRLLTPRRTDVRYSRWLSLKLTVIYHNIFIYRLNLYV